MVLSSCAPKKEFTASDPLKQKQETKQNSETTVRKSPIDKRDYKAFLLENGVKALVISDPETDMGAAAMSVHVGQFHDPIDRQGLAHFLEHMLFLGSEKYPDVGGYRKFIRANGGGSNAGTGQETTTYHFKIDQKSLEPALDQFSQFFISPLLDPEYVQREREAVNSEYNLKLKDDARRYREVRRKTSNPQHPFAKFSVGNLETLGDRENQPVFEDLKIFYEREYSADRMSLAVIGRQDIQTLQKMVTEKFSTIPKRETRTEERPAPFLPEQLQALIEVVPLAERRSVELQFPGPSQLPHFRERPAELLQYLIGHYYDYCCDNFFCWK